MAARKNVPAAEVRSWGRANVSLVPEAARAGLGENARGRIHPDLLAAFRKANPRKDYAVKVAESRTVTVPVVMLDKAGRKTTRKATIATSEARAALGHDAGRRGRISMADLSDVLSQREAAKVAGQFK